MAYNIVPKSEKELVAVNENAFKLIPLYREIVKRFNYKEPFAFDKKYKDRVKLSRAFSDDFDVRFWSKETGIKVEFGNGTRGSGGINKGIAFEGQFHTDLINYISEGETAIKHLTHVPAIRQLESLIPRGMFLVNATLDGGMNQRRETNITRSGVKASAGNVDIGSVVTDITLELASKRSKNTRTVKKLYLSLKSGGIVSFINLGVKSFLKQSEIEKGVIKNIAGRQVLDLLKIDHERFCEVFNTYKGVNTRSAPKDYVDVTSKLKNDTRFNEFLKSVIGYGYVMVHKMGRTIHVFEMDKRTMDDFLKVSKVIIEYPKDGSAKRVDVKVQLSGMELNINIRSSDGGVYPSHLFANYKIYH